MGSLEICTHVIPMPESHNYPHFTPQLLPQNLVLIFPPHTLTNKNVVISGQHSLAVYTDENVAISGMHKLKAWRKLAINGMHKLT